MRAADTPLTDACRHGRLADVTAILKGDANVNEPTGNAKGSTPLSVACGKGHLDIVSTLLSAGAAVNLARTDDGSTPLSIACYNGYLDIVSTLLSAGAAVNLARTDSGSTPLSVACHYGHLDIVSTLLSAGAAVNLARTDIGSTPLSVACGKGHLDIVSTLLSAGAAVNLARTDDGSTPLSVACHYGHLDIVSTLLSAGAAVNLARTDEGSTPLSVACGKGHLDIVSMLLSAGAAANHVCPDGLTPLITATDRGYTEVVVALCSAGAAVNQDFQGVTPMQFSCRNGHLRCVQVLSSFSATRDPYAQAQAAAHGHADIAAWLATSHQWSTPLHHISIIGAERARTLLRDGADLHARADAAGPTPLSLARALRAAGNAADGSAAQLVLMAAEPWCPRTHALFPAGARAFAAELLLLGHQLSRQPRFDGEEVSLSDIWVDVVMPHAVVRG